MTNEDRLTPLLVVRDAAEAIDFYARAFGATELVRYEHPFRGDISHADLAIGCSRGDPSNAIHGARFSITEEARARCSDAPPSLGGSPVVLQLLVDDAEAAF